MSKVAMMEVLDWDRNQIVREINQREQRIEYLTRAVAWARACKDCDQLVAWIKTDAGKAMLINRDGVSHFATCPGAQRRRRR